MQWLMRIYGWLVRPFRLLFSGRWTISAWVLHVILVLLVVIALGALQYVTGLERVSSRALHGAADTSGCRCCSWCVTPCSGSSSGCGASLAPIAMQDRSTISRPPGARPCASSPPRASIWARRRCSWCWAAPPAPSRTSSPPRACRFRFAMRRARRPPARLCQPGGRLRHLRGRFPVGTARRRTWPRTSRCPPPVPPL